MQTMLQRAREWRQQNPTRGALIQFNYPNKVFLCAAISVAIKEKYVTANPAGIELMQALWPWDDQFEPTVAMVRAVLENSNSL